MNIPQEMILEQMKLGPLENFLYFIGDTKSKEIAIIDPAWDVEFICDQADAKGYKITKVLLTHGHPDHVNGLEELLNKHDVPVYISKHEAGFYKPQHKNIVEVDDGEKITVGSIEFTTIFTPGHSPGCQCFLYKNVLITGDLIFIDGCGRCDLPGSDPIQQYASLYNKLMKLDDQTILFTGHDYGPAPQALLSDQKRTNPYLTCSSLEEFLRERMGI